MKIESARILNAAFEDPEFVAALADAAGEVSNEWMQRGLQESQNPSNNFIEMIRCSTKAIVWNELLVSLQHRVNTALK